MDLRALVFNCTLKRSPEKSNTDALIARAVDEFHRLKVQTEVIRPVDFEVKPGTETDMGKGDDWPYLLQKVRDADVFILASPVWLGHLGSVAQRVLERMDAIFHEEQHWDPRTGQYFTYNKVAGALCTGNEDGGHEVTGHILWALQELGFTVPPNANSYWVGSAGPGPSYVEAGGEQHLFTNKTVLYTVHNLTYLARLLKANPIPTNLNELNERAKAMAEPATSRPS